MQEIFKVLHDQARVRGVTVFRGTTADPLHILSSPPLVIEFFDAPEKVEQAIEVLNGLLPPGHMISWSATQR
jgi:uncharacterized protein